jgi:mannitol/fructose-specific phosphotransferase system IIA component (Ntr-type)
VTNSQRITAQTIFPPHSDSALAKIFAKRVTLGEHLLSAHRMPGRVSQLLDPTRISLQVKNTKRTSALNEVAQLLATHPGVQNFEGFYSELLARDRLDTTSLGHGFAVPHARTDHVQQIVLAVGRSEAGVPFENGETVRLMFMLGTPKARPGDYLQVLSTLCRMLKDSDNRQAFLSAETPEDFVRVVTAAENKLLGAA